MPNNSLIVECGEKSRYISYNNIYLTDVDYTTYSYVYSFDGEGTITSAIDYVISDELPKVYKLEGHGEAELPAEFQTQIEKENMEMESFSLLNMDEIPEDADALLTTSDEAFSKAAGFELSTYEKEDGDTDGPFAVAVSVDTGNDGQLIWFASSDFLDEMYNAYSSGANLDLAMNVLSSLIGEREAVPIRSKSLSYNYLTISESAASMLKTWMIGVIPGAFVVYGVFTVIERRRRRHA